MNFKERMRMDAYYYQFFETGILEVDLILSAIACAGKVFHHTRDWYEDVCPDDYDSKLIGDTPIEWIQNAANKAAEKLKNEKSKK